MTNSSVCADNVRGIIIEEVINVKYIKSLKQLLVTIWPSRNFSESMRDLFEGL